ncbi:hypothetical protein LA374_00420 [Aeromonas schubertii]|uniref:Phage protein n=1 Tax=Aeromonas schubertii TaxID=652 RepID=A0ABS7V5N2_9GAMM|nr:hypothetical protein [Aeromonas schubertii]MBZ6064682.1 hypothetical protein [Aeromonas schubertii]
MENNTAVPATRRKAAQRQRQAALGIQRVEVKLSARERETLAALCRLRAPSGDPYTADEYISTLIRRDMERYQAQLQALAGQTCQHCNNPLPQGCGGAFDGEHACWRTRGNKTLTL